MSSLWTPSGEHRVPREGESPEQESAPREAAAPPRPGGEGPGASAGAEEEMAAVARELAATPVESVVANHCYGLFELAALHLSGHPPNLAGARLAIDAMGLVVDGLGDRLGEAAGPLAEGLSQVRLAFVRIAEASDSPRSNGQGAQADAPPRDEGEEPGDS